MSHSSDSMWTTWNTDEQRTIYFPHSKIQLEVCHDDLEPVNVDVRPKFPSTPRKIWIQKFLELLISEKASFTPSRIIWSIVVRFGLQIDI